VTFQHVIVTRRKHGVCRQVIIIILGEKALKALRKCLNLHWVFLHKEVISINYRNMPILPTVNSGITFILYNHDLEVYNGL